MNWVAIQKALQNWVVSCTGLAADHVVWAQQYAPRPTQPAIIMRLSLINDGSRPWLEQEVNNLSFDPVTVTADATANTFTSTAHGLLTGDGPVELHSTGTMPGNTSDTVSYWVVKVDDDTFKLAESFLDSMNPVPVTVDLSSAGTGTITVESNGNTLRQGEELEYKALAMVKAMLTLECYTAVGVGNDMATSILWRINARRALPTSAAILEDANIGVGEVGKIRSIDGMQDLALFEPRAFVDILLNLVSEDSEYITIIERTEITNEDIPDTFTVDAAE